MTVVVDADPAAACRWRKLAVRWPPRARSSRRCGDAGELGGLDRRRRSGKRPVRGVVGTVPGGAWLMAWRPSISKALELRRRRSPQLLRSLGSVYRGREDFVDMARLLLDDFLDWVRPVSARCASCGHGALSDNNPAGEWVCCMTDACKRVRAHTRACSAVRAACPLPEALTRSPPSHEQRCIDPDAARCTMPAAYRATRRAPRRPVRCTPSPFVVTVRRHRRSGRCAAGRPRAPATHGRVTHSTGAAPETPAICARGPAVGREQAGPAGLPVRTDGVTALLSTLVDELRGTTSGRVGSACTQQPAYHVLGATRPFRGGGTARSSRRSGAPQRPVASPGPAEQLSPVRA